MTARQPPADISPLTFAVALVLLVAAFGGLWYVTRPIDLPNTIAATSNDEQIRPDPKLFLPIVKNSIGMTLAHVPSGEFVMGDGLDVNAHRHRIRMLLSFFIGTHEVTQAQYKVVTGRNPSEFVGSDNAPVESVTWEDARSFCAQLTALPAEQAAGRVYRLPTEAEWEYACRAGSTGLFWFGDFRPNMMNTLLGGLSRPSTVGLYPPNPWGLYDMHGNVWEWCADWYEIDYYQRSPREDPLGPPMGIDRVTRGGSWKDRPELARSAYRSDAFAPDYRGSQVGFRVACDVKQR
jgi:formylglycine-generating enzyme required for sulfatase activity